MARTSYQVACWHGLLERWEFHWILGLASSAIPVMSTIHTLCTGSCAIASVKRTRNVATSPIIIYLHSLPDVSKRHDCSLVSIIAICGF